MTLEKWDRLTDVPLFILSVLFLGAYSWQILQGTYLTACFVIINVVWCIYGIDYVVSLCLAKDRWLWFKRNIVLLLTLILPVFRPLRMLRFVAMLEVFNRSAGNATRGRITLYATCAVTMLIYVGALAEYSAEHTAPGATITSFPLALWWAFVTVTTVGYGDVCPVTMEGRCVAVVLMMTGIALIGIVSAMISSWIIDQVDARATQREDAAASAKEAQDAAQAAQGEPSSAEMRLLRAEVLRLSDSVSQLNTELQRTRRIARKRKSPDSSRAVVSDVRQELIRTIDPSMGEPTAADVPQTAASQASAAPPDAMAQASPAPSGDAPAAGTARKPEAATGHATDRTDSRTDGGADSRTGATARGRHGSSTGTGSGRDPSDHADGHAG